MPAGGRRAAQRGGAARAPARQPAQSARGVRVAAQAGPALAGYFLPILYPLMYAYMEFLASTTRI